MSSSAARAKWRAERKRIIRQWANENTIPIEMLNNDYQIRVYSVIDIYPTNGRWHILATGERGDWHLDTNGLDDLLVKAIDAQTNPHMMSAAEFDKKYPQGEVPIPDFTVPRKTLENVPQPKVDKEGWHSAALVRIIEEKDKEQRQRRRTWKFWRWF